MKVTKFPKSGDMASASTSSRGEKCLAKFTSSNGSVFGSLALNIRKAGDYSQPLPVAIWHGESRPSFSHPSPICSPRCSWKSATVLCLILQNRLSVRLKVW